MDQFRPLDMTGRTGADADDVPAHGRMAELRKKGAYPHYGGRCDLSHLTDPPQGLRRQKVVFLLEGMEDRDYIGRTPADTPDDVSYCPVEVLSFRLLILTHFLCSTDFFPRGYRSAHA